MLYRTEDNLISRFRDFVDDTNGVSLFTGYLKLKALEEVNRSKHITQIVVRWDLRDLVGASPASDLEGVYKYCQVHGIALYRNPNLHMKVLWDGKRSAIVGSANITLRGLGLASRPNFEASVLVDRLESDDLIYLNRMMLMPSAQLVTDEVYKSLSEYVELWNESHMEDIPNEVDLDLGTEERAGFLVSHLPLFKDVANLHQKCHKLDLLSEVERNCILHDLALFGLSASMTKADFYSKLKIEFFNLPFIAAYLNQVKSAEVRRWETRPSFGFTQSTIWFADHAIQVPIPKRWELVENVSVIFDWIHFLADGVYTIEIPKGHAQVIFYNG
jgi:hypothetical protein